VSAAAARRRLLLRLATSAAWQRAIRALPAPRFARRHGAGSRVADALACAHRLAAAGRASSIDLFAGATVQPLSIAEPVARANRRRTREERRRCDLM
jgi:hypothetical protein